jgi:hypothetical protein
MTFDVLRISFQDPDGFVFSNDSKVYRVVLNSYRDDLSLLIDQGILDFQQLVRHKEIDINSFPYPVITWIFDQVSEETFLTIFELNKIEFISYPWEWTPYMLQEAAKFTLNFQSYLLEKGFTLKDASFYNVQFINGNPVFIDLLSIKKCNDKLYPWFAYGQFLQHFVFPLIIIKYKNFDSLQFLQAYPNGISKSEVLRHISFSSYFSFFEIFHIHLFKHLDKDESNIGGKNPMPSIDRQKQQLKQLISFVESYTKNMLKKPMKRNNNWINYYSENTLADYTDEKKNILITFLDKLGNIERAVDLGANTGLYSEIMLKYTPNLLSVEQDNNCCEIIRSKMNQQKYENIQWQLICSNLLYPSPAIGWLNLERKSLIERMRSPLVSALALIHHFYFSGSIGFIQIAEFFNVISTRYIIVEFIDKSDAKVILLAQKNNTRLFFYSEENFTGAMSHYFSLQIVTKISTTRSLFLFNKNI